MDGVLFAICDKDWNVDKDKLKAGKYNVAIVFSSSIEGDYFRGAVGSTLYIDEVELIHAAD